MSDCSFCQYRGTGEQEAETTSLLSRSINIVVTQGALKKAFSLAAEEINMLWHVKGDVESIAEKLEMIQALLADAESKHTSSRAIEVWLKRLQNVSSEADNLLDEFAYEVLRKKMEKRMQDKVRTFFSCSNPLAFRFKIAHKISNIKSSIEEVYKEADRIGLRPVEITMSTIINPRSERLSTDPFIDDSKIVGRSKDVKKVVSMLTSSEMDDKNLALIAIVGMAGLGKTTIAQLIYKNKEVVRYFDYKLWIHVSDDFKVEKLLNNMVQSLTGTVSKLTIGEAIVRKLNEVLNAKRFLLVLDDVWNEDAEKWERMRKCLQEIGGSKGSRIIVTTRSERVVSIMQASFSYQLGILSDDESWTLFEKIAFGDDGAVKTPELMDIGRKIVAKCGGVPLAIKAMGGLMYSKSDEREWSKIEKSKTWVTLDQDEAGNRVKSAIKLSYDHLPSLSLKQCLVCCSLFEKGIIDGSVIRLENVLWLWMAQGLLNPPKGSQLEMEDVGTNYINILLQSSLLQVATKDEYGKITSFKIHDLVHDFISEVAKDCFLVPLDEVVLADDKEDGDVSSRKRIREIVSKQRTLVLTGAVELILGNCKYLRALTLANEGITELPNVIGKLTHLRYLDISKTRIMKLPNSITKLYNLQTVRLYNLHQLPKSFGKMANLRHLCIEGFKNGKPCTLPNIGQLSSLETLSFFYVSRDKGCQIEELGHLHNLKGDLKIFGLENVNNQEEAIKAKLSKKINLESLELHWDTETREESTDEDILKGLEPHSNLKGFRMENFMGRNLPSWMLTTSYPLVLRNLVKIVLKNFNKCEQIPPLGNLPYLKIAKIIGMKIVKCISSDLYGWKNIDDATSRPSGLAAGDVVVAFPALKELILEDMPNLTEWSAFVCHDPSHSAIKVFPCLEILRVENCPKLISLPTGIWNSLTCIKELSIVECHSLIHLPEDVGKLASLEVLNLDVCPKLVWVPDIHSLVSLKELTIMSCHSLPSLPSGIEVCTSISLLTVGLCRNLQPEDLHRLPTIRLRVLGIGGFSNDLDYFPWPMPSYTIENNVDITKNNNNEFQHSFASLEALLLRGWPKLTFLPKQIQHLSTLTSLFIMHFDGIEALPEWLGNIHSLQRLAIEHCKNVLYLPSAESMRCLTNLRKLIIDKCPLLEERCKKEIGPEWHKIAHIPEIEIDPQSLVI